jgi:hypothetical protein
LQCVQERDAHDSDSLVSGGRRVLSGLQMRAAVLLGICVSVATALLPGSFRNPTVLFSFTKRAVAILFASPNTHERVAIALAASVRSHNAFDLDRSDGKPTGTIGGGKTGSDKDRILTRRLPGTTGSRTLI